ncbi:hypothetical protein TNCT_714581, partial [Trichonephila clavata]
MKTGKLNPDDNEISWIGSFLPLGAIIGGLIAEQQTLHSLDGCHFLSFGAGPALAVLPPRTKMKNAAPLSK